MIRPNNGLRNKKSEEKKFNSILRVSTFVSDGNSYRVTLHSTGLVDLHQGDQLIGRVHTVLWRRPDKGFQAKFTTKLGGQAICFLPRLPDDAFRAFWATFLGIIEDLPEYLLKRLYVRCRGEKVYFGETTEIVLAWSPEHEVN